MEVLYFSRYRLLAEFSPAQWGNGEYMKDFSAPRPFTHTFTLQCVVEPEIQPVLNKYKTFPVIASPERYSLHKLPEGFAFLMPPRQTAMGAVLLASADYGTMTLHIENHDSWVEIVHQFVKPSLPFPSIIRSCCEAAMATRCGVPLHASLVAKNGEGVLFLGPSGMGKSTQAKLWQKYLDADFISGDRPGLRLLDGKWYAFGMPWDGKDGLHCQRGVPVKALVVLEQARENRIRQMSSMEANIALFHQAVLPAWDNRALDGIMPLLAHLSAEVPFYHLSCLPDQQAAELTYQTLFHKKG